MIFLPNEDVWFGAIGYSNILLHLCIFIYNLIIHLYTCSYYLDFATMSFLLPNWKQTIT